MKKLKLLRVVGARPQFMQVKPLREELISRGHTEILLHTGQHYDDIMSRKFFEDLNLPMADINLGIKADTHGEQTGEMIKGIEKELIVNSYDAVVVDGDTNSTLAGALAASKLNIPVVHIESGMRSYNKLMPEEINRILTDHISEICFCPSNVSKENLYKEGITKNVFVVGDVLAQCFHQYKNYIADIKNEIIEKYQLESGKYRLLTMHRAENIKNKDVLAFYINKIKRSSEPIVWPLHPHTKKMIEKYELGDIIYNHPFKIIEPVGYLEMMALESESMQILTDSGGVQREAFHWNKPTVILRNVTEWVEIIDNIDMKLAIPFDESIDLLEVPKDISTYKLGVYGENEVSKKIVDIMEKQLI